MHEEAKCIALIWCEWQRNISAKHRMLQMNFTLRKLWRPILFSISHVWYEQSTVDLELKISKTVQWILVGVCLRNLDFLSTAQLISTYRHLCHIIEVSVLKCWPLFSVSLYVCTGWLNHSVTCVCFDCIWVLPCISHAVAPHLQDVWEITGGSSQELLQMVQSMAVGTAQDLKDMWSSEGRLIGCSSVNGCHDTPGRATHKGIRMWHALYGRVYVVTYGTKEQSVHIDLHIYYAIMLQNLCVVNDIYSELIWWDQFMIRVSLFLLEAAWKQQ